MKREQIVRLCAIRERAVDAAQEARRHIYDMATLALSNDQLLHGLAEAGESLDLAMRTLEAVKNAALAESRRAA